MLRTGLGRFVLCAVSRSSPQRALLASELLRPRGVDVKFASTAAAAAHAHTHAPPPHFNKHTPPKTETEETAEEGGEGELTDRDHLLFHTLAKTLHPNTLKAIPHTHMSPVQAQILPLLPDLAESHSSSSSTSSSSSSAAAGPPARDLLVKAKTGTGKTMAFLIPAIQSRLRALSSHSSSPRDEAAFARTTPGCLIISPTRELATQIAVEAAALTKYHKGWGVQLLLGGESKPRQLRMWEGGRKDVVVATPGRVLDLLSSERSVSDVLSKCELLILDEADTLLDMGFRDDITRLLTYLPPQPIRQTFLFSATVSRAIQQIAQASLSPNHKYINCVSKDDSPVHAHIPQHVKICDSGSDILPYILRLIAADQLAFDGTGPNKTKSKIVIFLSTTNAVILYSAFLRRLFAAKEREREHEHVLPTPSHDIALFEMHAKREQAQRSRVSAAFRGSKAACSILVTSDVSARGVDYPGVTRVIQVGLPASLDMYVHRVGRTGRGASTTGRGDLVLMDWEEPFVKRRMGGIALRRVGEGDVEREIKDLGDVVPPGQIRERWGKDKREKLVSAIDAVVERIGSGGGGGRGGGGGEDLVRAAFSSSAGFFAGRLGELALEGKSVLNGLQTMWESMWGVERGRLVPPRGVVDAMGGGGRGGGASFGRGGRGRVGGGHLGSSSRGGGGGGGGWSGRGGGGGGGGWSGSGGGGGGGGGRSGGFGRDAQRSTGSGGGFGGWEGNSLGWGQSSSPSSSSGNWATSPSSSPSLYPASSSSYVGRTSASTRTGYGYDKGSRVGAEYSRAGRYEKAGRRGGDAAWERGGESAWSGSGSGRGGGGSGRGRGGWD